MAGATGALDEMRKMQSVKQRGAKCTVGTLLRTLPEQDRNSLDEALSDETIDSNTISAWLANRGGDVKRHTVARHRRKECRCNG